ncbi:MAG: hypothetical protein PHQ90_13395 [Sulfuricurvum sp.]|uniref:hypothetical protein n=1 Tax=Sulfuricurvum sp. TaxID=2025608 RepID=UPI00263305D4|nr:hypothetical protein [Sulfuricurvum sp.]MDD2370291.1 hypothetical protein [Sulfuricurvum sp.]MDD2950277.1 hypothetical protein [Sulfuricurvum sp.]MDD5117140.1 hypothetical protein [Sulfuricurvum sp.]
MILHTLDTLLKSGESAAILGAVSSALARSDEAPFWRQKSLPFCEAVLSVLIPLREQNLLFDPEGNPHTELTPVLFIRWCDLLSLKTLAFTLAKSNDAGKLLRTKIDSDSYQPVDLEILGKYLSGYSVNLSDEWVDFPITNYNLHIGMTSLLTKILEGKC